MTGGEILIALGGVLVGFGLCDVYYYLTLQRDRRLDESRPIAEGWDHITHVRVIK